MSKWMIPAAPPSGTYMVVFRCRFEVGSESPLSFRFSADNRAQIFLDGERLTDGPERGAAQYWYYQNAAARISVGRHVLTARVICLDPDLKTRGYAYGQMGIRHGFFLEETGTALLREWDCQIEDGCTYESPFPDWGTFPRIKVGAGHNPRILYGEGGVWEPVRWVEDNRVLHAPDLPPMRYDAIKPECRKPGLLYFPTYVCAWTRWHFTGHGTVKIRWSETPYRSAEFDHILLRGDKGCRDGSCFIGKFDVFEVDGELIWYDFWWRAGHYVEVQTEGNVQYHGRFFRTGYPYPDYKPRSTLEKMALETLQACSWETYMDCPFYEQLLYVGDSRLEALCTYKLFDDHRLPAKSLRLLSLSQHEDGSLCSQYPSCGVQKIPSFMLIWLLMLADYHDQHRNDPLVAELRPRAAKLLDYLKTCENGDGLLAVPGWNFIDWCEDWENGVPPGGQPDSISNLFYVLALRRMAKMELRPGLAEKADTLAAVIRRVYFDEGEKLYSLDCGKRYFSEHPQVLALLVLGDVSVIPGLRRKKLTQCSIYFSYYYLEACRNYGLDDLKKKRLARWEVLQNEGLTTFPEEFDNPRSDCHAWSSHILCFL